MPRVRRLPPFCGHDLSGPSAKPFLYNPYQVDLLDARRQRICPACTTIAPVDGFNVFRCPTCHVVETSQLRAIKAFHRIGIVGGRRSGKTKVGAFAAREECTAPGGLGWIMGPTFKILHDSTMPTFFRILPPEWIADWDSQNMDLYLVNGHIVQFRSLDDPERGRGQGPWWGWLDEVQKMRQLAWDVFRPSLTENRGNAIFTFTPNGFDWTWKRLYREAFDYKTPGFWMARCRTLDNPFIQMYARDEVEEARRTMPAQMFRQEYEADFVSFAGNVYDWEAIEPQILRGTDAIRAFIPEYPKLDPSRTVIMGIGGGVTHPFAATMIVATPRGLVALADYRNEHRSAVYHHDRIQQAFKTWHVTQATPTPLRWACDEEQSYVFREFAARGTGVIPTEHYLLDGVQRVQTWLYAKQLYFASDASTLIDHLREYRWNDSGVEPGEERPTEDRDYRENDELPKALHAAVLSWPELPAGVVTLTDREAKLDDRTRAELAKIREFEKGDLDNPNDFTTRQTGHDSLGDFYGEQYH